MKILVFMFLQCLDIITLYKVVDFGGKIQNGVEVLPWVGILHWKGDKRGREAVTGIILIAKDMALGSAIDISNIDKKSARNTTSAMFLIQNNIPWYRQLNDYILHPEFKDKTSNTIALLVLEPLKNDSYLRTISFYWPVQSYLHKQNIFTVGLTDEQEIIKQVIYKVVGVNKSECQEFYERERLDFESIWPTNYQCYKNVNTNRTCLSERGLALAYNASGKWIPLGISTYGPGCSLPCRFIELVAYTKWIRAKKKMLKSVKSMRRFFNFADLEFGKDFRPYRDLDSAIFSYLHSNLPSPLYTKWNGVLDNVDDECEYNSEDIVVYSEEGYIITKSSEPQQVIMSVTLFDLSVEKIYCVEVTVKATARSNVKKFYNFGIEQDDATPFIKQIPIIGDGETEVGPKILTMVNRPDFYTLIETTNIFYKFMFTGRADIKVRFYGRPLEFNATTPEPGAQVQGQAQATTTTRKPRKYSTNIRRPG